jgi:hypothetical protein
VSYQLSTNKHFNFSPKLSPLGLGKSCYNCSKISSIPSPVFPEHGIAFSVSIPITSSISFFVLSKSDAGNQFCLKLVQSHDQYLKLDKHLQEFVLLLLEYYQQLKLILHKHKRSTYFITKIYMTRSINYI